jgi:hypothetical protein
MIPAFFPGFVGEVWIQPGQEASQGEIYRHKAEGGLPWPGSVALVLGEWRQQQQQQQERQSDGIVVGGMRRPGSVALVLGEWRQQQQQQWQQQKRQKR